MNRSSRRDHLFTRDDDCLLFLAVLSDVPDRFEARIHGYALMPNHYHLLIEVPRGNLSEVMRYVGLVFTQAYNRVHGFDGPLFRGRYKNRLVQDDEYWMHLLAYLHLNPVMARLAKRPGDALWTSHAAYSGEVPRPEWLTTDDFTRRFGSVAALEEYVEGVRRKSKRPPDGFNRDQLWSVASTAEVPEVKEPAPRTFEQALQEVAKLRGVAPSDVLSRPGGRTPNVSAWLAVWWLTRATRMSQREVARRIGISRPRVSQIVNNLWRLARSHPEVREQMEALEVAR